MKILILLLKNSIMIFQIIYNDPTLNNVVQYKKEC
jgi:hypothetical protein